MVLFFKILCKTDTGLIVLVITLIDVAAKEIRGSSCVLLQTNPQIGVAVSRKGNREHHDKCKNQGNHQADTVQDPASFDATAFMKGFHGLPSLLEEQTYAPHL